MRGQVTIFVILGLVVVIAFGLLLYVGTNEVETSGAITDSAAAYLESCTENTVFEYLDSLAEPSLVLRGPSLEGPVPGINDNLTELFGLIEERYNDGIQSTLFGNYDLTPLCDPDGPNSLSKVENTHCYRLSYGDNSHQEQLTQEITQELIECSNEGVDAELGLRLSDWPDPLVTVSFGRANIRVQAEYESLDVVVETNIESRLLQLYSFIEERLQMTTKDPRITITDEQHAQISTYYREGFVWGSEQEDEQWRYVFTDTSSTYRGTQLTIAFFGEDRLPYEDTYANPPMTYDPDG